MAMTRQQLEQQLVAAHRTKNVQAAQQAAYAIRAYDQNVLSAQVPIINAPPPIERVPKPTFGSWLENVGIGIGEGLGEQVQGIGELAQRGVSALGAYAQDPLKASAAAFVTAFEPARQFFTQPVQVTKDIGTGIVETGKQMYQQATSGPIGLGHEFTFGMGTPEALNVSDLQTQPDQDKTKFGKRPDGSEKGRGYLGLLRRPDGKVSSEISVGVEIDGKEKDIPLLVPTLTRGEVDALLALPTDKNFNKNLPPSILNKAVAFARQRIVAGKDVFAAAGDSPSAAPAAAKLTILERN